MSFLGLEEPVQYTGYQIFDPTMAKMILDAQDKYFNAVYADYQQGLEDMKEFKKEYYDFDTPILADQDWYNRNVTGKVRNFINDAYARGIDLTRTPEGRAAIAQVINSVDVGKVAKLRSSAENAKEFLKTRKALEAQGLYNPLLAKYDAPDMSTYSTLDQGIWDKMSPTRITDMATFGNPYFEGMKPNIRKESKNGIEYSIESITADDLRNIANNHFNELVSTPQGRLMYQYYRDQVNGTEEEKDILAREMFNNAVAAGQQRRIYEKSDYDDMWQQHQQIAQGWKRIEQADKELQLKQQQFEWEKEYYEGLGGGSGSGSGSSSGEGGSNSSPSQGTATMVSYDQDKQYIQERENFEKKLKSEETKAFSKLSGGDVTNAKYYKNAKKVLADKNSSKQDKQSAQKTIERLKQNGSQQLKDWSESYDRSVDPNAWNKYSSSIGENTPWGTTQHENVLMNKAHEAFYRQNILNSPLDIGARADMNTSLGIVEDGDGNKIGTVTSGTEFAPISEAEFTGDRRYRYNSKISKVNRLIKGKQYSVTPSTESSREYGSGEIGGTKYNIVTQRVQFTDESVINELKTWGVDELQRAGIRRITDGVYEIPIITKFSRGSQTWANVNTETDKRVGGNSEATRNRATRQAGSVLSKIK